MARDGRAAAGYSTGAGVGQMIAEHGNFLNELLRQDR